MNNIEIIASTVSEAVEAINKARLANRKAWIVCRVNVNGLDYALKSYETWTQRFEAPSFTESGVNGLKVAAWKAELTKLFSA